MNIITYLTDIPLSVIAIALYRYRSLLSLLLSLFIVFIAIALYCYRSLLLSPFIAIALHCYRSLPLLRLSPFLYV
jgi:hypothetical protein